MQVLLTPRFEGRVEFNQRRLGKNIPDGGTSLNKGLEMGVAGHWEGPKGWMVAPVHCRRGGGLELKIQPSGLSRQERALH